MTDYNGEAYIENGEIVIKVGIKDLQCIIDGGYACGFYDQRFKVTDLEKFAKDLCYELNHEDEQGTTPIHKLFDKCIDEAVNQGSMYVEVHEEQEF